MGSHSQMLRNRRRRQKQMKRLQRDAKAAKREAGTARGRKPPAG